VVLADYACAVVWSDNFFRLLFPTDLSPMDYKCYSSNLQMFLKTGMFVCGRFFQPSWMLMGKARGLPLSEVTFRHSTLGYRLCVLSTNIWLGWKSLPETDTLAFINICKLWPKFFVQLATNHTIPQTRLKLLSLHCVLNWD
jgi:hypothetical protein